MPKILAALVLFLALTLQVTPALASCRTHTYMYNGQFVTCTTCCYGGFGCNTTCF
jgi:hypothetical protein